jgi:Sec-independent protein translocase protein TatA
MIGNIVGPDGVYIIIIALIVLVGGSQLPKIARNVGLAGREFRKAQHEAEQDAGREKAAKAPSDAVPPPQALAAAATPAPVQPAPAPAATAPAATASAPTSGEAAISLTPAQLDALLKAREEQVRNETGPAPSDN